jgi:hypothetical protein
VNNDEKGDSGVDPMFELGDEIQTFNHVPLVKVILQVEKQE